MRSKKNVARHKLCRLHGCIKMASSYMKRGYREGGVRYKWLRSMYGVCNEMEARLKL